MKIQIISLDRPKLNTEYDITYSTLNRQQSFDAFDVNIISLQSPNLWYCKEGQYRSIDSINDLISLKRSITNARSSKIIVCMPMNYIVKYNCPMGDRYYNTTSIKDHINTTKNILSYLLPVATYELLYEVSKTKCMDNEFIADFLFQSIDENASVLTKNIGGNNATTISVSSNLILTTLSLFQLPNALKDFLQAINVDCASMEYPEWLNDYVFYNDAHQKEVISEKQGEIASLEEEIKVANAELKQNMRYKSILVTSGNNLVDVVFDMLQKMLVYDLSSFIDEKKEDFRIVFDDVTFIGEIKGITSNVKSEHVSQLDVHVQSYVDSLESVESTQNLKGLLIINPFRSKIVEQREPVHQQQIKLAIRNNSLIITSDVLLVLFQYFLQGQIATAQILDIFKSKTGLLELKDFI